MSRLNFFKENPRVVRPSSSRKKVLKSKSTKSRKAINSNEGGNAMAKKKKKVASKRKAGAKKVAKKKVAKKASTRKKATRKKVAKKAAPKKVVAKKATKKKAIRRKSRKSKAKAKVPAIQKPAKATKAVAKPAKNRKVRIKQRQNMSKGSTILQTWTGAGRGKGNKGKKWQKMLVTHRSNPIGGGMKKVSALAKDYLKHDLGEAGGLFAGGMLHQASNDVIERFVPARILSKFEGFLGPFAGSVLPILVGVAVGKLIPKNDIAQSLSKGLIGAGVVGLGVTSYELVKPKSVSAPIEGMGRAPMISRDVGSDLGSYSNDFGQMTDDFGEIEMTDFGSANMETSDFGMMEDYYDEDYESFGTEA